MNAPPVNRYVARRPIVLGLVRIFILAAAHLPLISAAPVRLRISDDADLQDEPVTGATLWLYLLIAGVLVLCGGAFAGLTIALMGQVSFDHGQYPQWTTNICAAG